MRYPSKVKILNKIIEKGKKNFDYRLFYPLFESPCMRSVAYFALAELNHQDEYKKIKKAASSSTNTPQQAYSVFLKYENGTTKFYRKDIHTGDENEID